jgi:phage antirepressor YoqD-like protein
MSKELELFSEKERTMTVKEVAESLGTAESTIRNKVAELFPFITENGKATRLTELQVTEIKQSIVPRDLTLKSKLENSSTDIEMIEKSFEVMAWFKRKHDEHIKIIESQKTMLIEQAPKVQAYDTLIKTDTMMSLSNACKHFGIQPIKHGIPSLKYHGYLTTKNLPTQRAIDLDIMKLKETVGTDNRTHMQAVVEACQLVKFGNVLERITKEDEK